MEADPVVTFRNRLAEVKTDLDSAQQLNRDAAGKLSNLSTQTLAKLKEAVVVVEENVAVKSKLGEREEELKKVRDELQTLRKQLELAEMSRKDLESRVESVGLELEASKSEAEYQKDVVQYLEKVILFLTLSFPFSLFLERTVRGSKL